MNRLHQGRAHAELGSDWREAVACLDTLYSAATSGAWREVLFAVMTAFTADKGALLELVESGRCSTLAGVGVSQHGMDALGEWAGSVFVGISAISRGSDVPALRAAGCASSLYVGTVVEGGLTILCCLGWETLAPPQGTAARLGEMAPHLGRAVAIRRRLRRAAGEAEVTAAVLDCVTLGAILVDGQARPLLANRAAHRLAGEDDGFQLGQQGLRAASATQSKELRQMVAAVSLRRGGSLGERGGTLRLQRPSGRTPYEILVLPLPRGDHTDLFSDAVAVVFVTDPERHVQTPEQFVRGLYDLTHAEAKLAILLARGHSLSEAGDLLGVSRNTVHTHLSRIFVKTGTSRQSELVRRLLTAPARLAAEESSGHKPVVGDD